MIPICLKNMTFELKVFLLHRKYIYIYNNTVGQHASTNFVFPCQTIYIYIYIYIEHGGIISG
jgi:hypothetical protein